MTQNSSTQSNGGGPNGGCNRVSVVLVSVLGIAILLAVAFVGAIVLFRVISGTEPTPTAQPTLRPTFTPTVVAAAETQVSTTPAESPDVATPVPEETVEPTEVPETAGARDRKSAGRYASGYRGGADRYSCAGDAYAAPAFVATQHGLARLWRTGVSVVAG
jgi:hypothetical protein